MQQKIKIRFSENIYQPLELKIQSCILLHIFISDFNIRMISETFSTKEFPIT